MKTLVGTRGPGPPRPSGGAHEYLSKMKYITFYSQQVKNRIQKYKKEEKKKKTDRVTYKRSQRKEMLQIHLFVRPEQQKHH